MRDLKRHNAKLPAYMLLQENDFDIFVPMTWRLVTRHGVKQKVERPVIQDLLFVHTTRHELDPIVEETNTLQYRFMRNQNRAPMTVSQQEMERFIYAVKATDSPQYFAPEEITPKMYGRRIRIVGGALDGYEGCLITRRGSKVKRLLIELKDICAVGVVVNPEFIQLLK